MFDENETIVHKSRHSYQQKWQSLGTLFPRWNSRLNVCVALFRSSIVVPMTAGLSVQEESIIDDQASYENRAEKHREGLHLNENRARHDHQGKSRKIAEWNYNQRTGRLPACETNSSARKGNISSQTTLLWSASFLSGSINDLQWHTFVFNVS